MARKPKGKNRPSIEKLCLLLDAARQAALELRDDLERHGCRAHTTGWCDDCQTRADAEGMIWTLEVLAMLPRSRLMNEPDPATLPLRLTS